MNPGGRVAQEHKGSGGVQHQALFLVAKHVGGQVADGASNVELFVLARCRMRAQVGANVENEQFFFRRVLLQVPTHRLPLFYNIRGFLVGRNVDAFFAAGQTFDQELKAEN